MVAPAFHCKSRDPYYSSHESWESRGGREQALCTGYKEGKRQRKHHLSDLLIGLINTSTAELQLPQPRDATPNSANRVRELKKRTSRVPARKRRRWGVETGDWRDFAKAKILPGDEETRAGGRAGFRCARGRGGSFSRGPLGAPLQFQAKQSGGVCLDSSSLARLTTWIDAKKPFFPLLCVLATTPSSLAASPRLCSCPARSPRLCLVGGRGAGRARPTDRLIIQGLVYF
jgi:hypothetical protein